MSIESQLIGASHLPLPALANDRFIVPGVALSVIPQEIALPDDGLMFVGMNEAAYTEVPAGRLGQVYTQSLSGCTAVAAVAAVARTEQGALAGVSHFDPLVDASRLKLMPDSASVNFMVTFADRARERGAHAIRMFVAYDEMAADDESYGKRDGDYDTWHFLDQIEEEARAIASDVTLNISSYPSFTVNALAANVTPSRQVGLDFQRYK